MAKTIEYNYPDEPITMRLLGQHIRFELIKNGECIAHHIISDAVFDAPNGVNWIRFTPK